MARKNTTYLERQKENLTEGVSHSSEAPEAEQNELDKPDVQAAILRPETVEVPLADGSFLTIMPKLTLGQIFEKKVVMVITSLVQAVYKYGGEISGDTDFDEQWLARNIDIIPLISYKPAVQYIVTDLLEMLTKKHAEEIRPQVNHATVSATFILALTILGELTLKAGDHQAKNVL